MPLVPFDQLPDDARCWVFAAGAPLDEVDTPRLLAAVDAFLLTWAAHGTPLTSARDFRDELFLVVGVDERAAGASGCSIDGLFRVLQGIEDGIGTSMVGGGMVYFRGPSGLVHGCTRAQFTEMAMDGDVTGDTMVFDTTVTTVGDFRARFESPTRDAWQRSLLPS
jgi:hypothetical protein